VTPGLSLYLLRPLGSAGLFMSGRRARSACDSVDLYITDVMLVGKVRAISNGDSRRDVSKQRIHPARALLAGAESERPLGPEHESVDVSS
jgi:hypothetical protein